MNRSKIKVLSLIVAVLMVITSLPINTNASVIDNEVSSDSITQTTTDNSNVEEESVSKEEKKESTESSTEKFPQVGVRDNTVNAEQAGPQMKTEITSEDDVPVLEEPVKSTVSVSEAIDNAGVNCVTFYSTLTFSITKTNYFETNGMIEYLLGDPGNRSGWQYWTQTGTNSKITATKADDGLFYISLRGNDATYVRSSATYSSSTNDNPNGALTIAADGAVDVKGPVESLLDYMTVMGGGSPTMGDRTFSCLFLGCSKLTSTPSFTTTNLSQTSRAYAFMFKDCTGLREPADLPATILGENCYAAMFRGCTSIVREKPLMATQLATGCYLAMFMGCTELVTPPDLMASDVPDQAYHSMFRSCTKLQTQSNLGAISVGAYALGYMYYGDSLLKSASLFNIQNISEGCFNAMFRECTSLTSAPAIPYEIIPQEACSAMFYKCTSLTTAGDLAAIEVGAKGCQSMFTETSLVTTPKIVAEVVGANGFEATFQNIVTLETTQNRLPAMDLGSAAYASMYNGCKALKASPELPALDLKGNTLVYAYMFKNTYALTSTGKIAANAGIGAETFRETFYGTGIKECPDFILIHENDLSFGVRTFHQMFCYTWIEEFPDIYAGDFSGDKAIGGMFKYAHTKRIGKIHVGNENTRGKLAIDEGSYMFQYCKELEYFDGFDVIGNIGVQCFYAAWEQCNALEYMGDFTFDGSLNSTCFMYAFRNLRSLKETPVLNITQDVNTNAFAHAFDYCYSLLKVNAMTFNYVGTKAFDGCFEHDSAILEIGDITANTLNERAFNIAFRNTSSLINCPRIKVGVARTNACPNMFQNSGVQYVPSIEVNDAWTTSFASTFNNCQSLKKVGVITIGKAGSSAFSATFANCPIETIEEVTAENVSTNGLINMFNNTKITKISNVNIGSVTATDGLAGMFQNNSLLEEIEDLHIGSITGTKACRVMFNNCPLLKTIKDFDIDSITGDASVATIDMFTNCPLLTDVSNLTIGTVTAERGCEYMFQSNSTLKKGVTVNAGILGKYSLNKMYVDCTALEEVPPLRANIIGEGSCYNMFMGCTKLERFDDLTALTVGDYGYYGMFQNCTSLKATPHISATSIGSSACQYMFSGCSSLETATDLNATTLSDNCYYGMFDGCVSLKNAPQLPATTMCDFAYTLMFKNCKSLVVPPQLPAVTLAKSCYKQMFKGCESLRIYETAENNEFGNFNTKWTISKFAINNGDAFREMFDGCAASIDPVIGTTYYVYGGASINAGGNCVSFYSSEPFTIEKAETFETDATLQYLLGTPGSEGFAQWTNETLASEKSNEDNYYYISIAGEGGSYIRGNAGQGLIIEGTSGINVIGKIESLIDYIATGRDEHPVLAENAFANLFMNNTSLESAPVLGCVDLTESCYNSMFKGCTSLQTSPELPAETLANNCYANMFEGCTNLTTVPSLVATTLAEGCYQAMFKNCTSISKFLALPAEDVPANAYASMFSGCTSLKDIPELPATTLGAGCYSYMFEGCTSVIAPVELPATTLAQNCYMNMYRGCSSLCIYQRPTANDAGKYIHEWKIPAEESQSGWNTNMFINCGATVSPEVNTVYYILGVGTIYASAEDIEIEYDGEPHFDSNISVTDIKSDYNIQYSTNGVRFYDEIQPYTNIGENTIYYRITADGYDNYDGTYTLTIKKGNMEVYGIEQYFSYDKTGHVAKVNVAKPASGYTIYYKTSEEGEYDTIAPSFKELGTHTLFYKVTAPNYNDFEGSLQVVINENPTIDATSHSVEFIYDTLPHTGDIDIDIPENGENCTIEYSEDGVNYSTTKPSYINVGVYTVFYRISAPGYNAFDGSFTVTITKATLDVVSANETATYDGKKYNGSVMVTNANSKAYTITYCEEQFGLYSISNPRYSEAGTYTVYYKVEGSNYFTVTGNFTVTINHADMVVNASDAEKVYDGDPITGKVTVITPRADYSIAYSKNDSDYNLSEIPTYTDAGTYTVYFRVQAKNYNDYNGSLIVKITGLSLEATAEDVEVTYDGNPHKSTINVTTLDEGYTIYYGKKADRCKSKEELTYTNAGTYTIFYRVTAKNYEDFIGSYNMIINGLDMQVSAEGADVDYDGQPHKGSVAVTVPAEGAKVYYSAKRGRFTSTDEITYTNPGEYTVYYKVEADNYNDVMGSFVVKINKIDMDVTAEGVVVPYDEAEHKGSVTVNTPAEGYTIYYSESESSFTSTDELSYVEAGAHTVYFKVTATGYNDYIGSFVVKINGQDIEASAEDVTVDYDAEPHAGEIVVTNPTEGYTIYYSETEGEFTSTEPISFIDTGVHTVYYKVTSPGYNEYIGNYKVTINGENMVAQPEESTFKYDEKPHAANLIVTTPSEGVTILYGDTEDDYKWTEAPSYTEVGEYTVYYFAKAPGYNDLKGSYTITIQPAAEMIESIPIYRMQNPNTTECVWTASKNEYDKVTNAGWKKQGIAFYCFKEEIDGAVPIYRMYNPNGNNGKGDHHYTKSVGEINKLVKVGWKKDFSGKPVFYAPSDGDITVYKLYDKGRTGCHVYTASETENNNLGKKGWVKEGIAWTSVKEGDTRPKSEK